MPEVCAIPLIERIESARADEENLSTEPYQAVTDPWLPRANEDSFGKSDSQKTTVQGAQAPGCQRRLEVTVNQHTGRFGRSDRILESKDFRRISRGASRSASSEFVVLMGSRPEKPFCVGLEAPRLGLSTPRRVGNSVVRNYIKRSVREWFRQTRHQLPPNTDLVVIARPGAASLSALGFGASLDRLVARNPFLKRMKESVV